MPMRSMLSLALLSSLIARFDFVKGKQTIKADWSDDYPYQVSLETHKIMSINTFQKLTAFNPAGTLLAVGTTDETVTVLTFPALDRLFEVNVGKGDTVGELVDVSFSGDGQWVRFNRHIPLN